MRQTGAKEMSWANKRWSRAKKKAIIGTLEFARIKIMDDIAFVQEVIPMIRFLKEKWKL